MNDDAACPCEKERQSEHSPGLIADEESIALVILDPDQWSDGELVDTAFPRDKLKKGELSVCRTAYTTVKIAHDDIIDPQLAKNSNRSLVGAMKIAAATVRSIRGDHDSERIFCVSDAGIPTNPGHAHLGFSKHTTAKDYWNKASVGGEKNGIVAARAELSRVFSSGGLISDLTKCFDKAE